MKQTVLFACEKCGFESTDEQAVKACEAVPIQRRDDLKFGDIVINLGTAYGWWATKEGKHLPVGCAKGVDEEWFLVERRDPNHRSHHVRGQLGFPKFVVVGKAMYKDVGGNGDGAGWTHRECVLLYSPRWANSDKPNATALFWIPPDYRTRTIGQVSAEDLERYQAAANGRRSYLI